ncbi:MAG: hypothetical protein HOV94_25160, partial [Saccharothrix sp.]|nr:hypothetical protein [Saccharothrix sp.]
MEPDLPVLNAERAVLGAALLDPTTMTRVPWLGTIDWRQPYHAETWAVMRNIGPEVSAREFPHRVLAGLQGTDAARAVTAPRLHDMMAGCPHPNTVPYYAAMVVEGGTRRTLHDLGHHLQYVAERADDNGIEDTLDEAVHTKGQVDAVAERWHQVPEDLRDQLDKLATGPDQEVPWPTPPTIAHRHAEPQAERAVIGAVLANPDLLHQIGWLDPRDFGTPALAGAWDAIHHLRRHGAPIDAVTLEWQLQHLGRELPPHGELHRIAAEALPGLAEKHALVIGGGAALDRIDLAGRQLTVLADAHQIPPVDVLGNAQTVVQQLPFDAERVVPRLPAR